MAANDLMLFYRMVDFLAHGMIDAAYFLPDLAFVFMLTLALVKNAGAAVVDWPPVKRQAQVG